MASATVSSQKSSWMNRSTIYQRNQARRNKTLARLAKQRRDAAAGVAAIPPASSIEAMSRIVASIAGTAPVLAPLEPSSAKTTPVLSGVVPEVANFDDNQDVFTINASFKNSTATQSFYNTPSSARSLSSANASVPNVMLAAAVGGAFSEAFTFRMAAVPSTRTLSSSLHHMTTRASRSSASVVPIVDASSSSLSLLLRPHFNTPATTTKRMWPVHSAIAQSLRESNSNTVRNQQIMGRALSASLLFGTQVVVQQRLLSTMASSKHQEQQRQLGDSRADQSFRYAAATLLSSAVAGGVLGVSRMVLPLLGTSSIAPTQHVCVQREILGATAYFGSYQMLKSLLATRRSRPDNDDVVTGMRTQVQCDTNSLLSIAVAGGLAGGIYQTVRMAGTAAAATTASGPFASAMPQVRPSLALGPSVIRAVPAHAVLFLAYETALGVDSSN